MPRMPLFRIAAVAVLAIAASGAPGLANHAAPSESQVQTDLKAYMGRLAVGKPEAYGGLTLYPVTASKDFSLDRLLTLDEALKHKALVVTELEGGAEVNTLMLENVSDRSIFIMSGEIMRGAKQDRTMQNDLLIPPKSGKMKVSVFCTEHGRWTETSRSFQASEQAVPNSVRQAAKVDKQQGRVWSSIEQNQAKLRAAAPTSAAKDVYENKQVKQELQPFVDHLAGLPGRHPGMVGVVAAYGDRLIAVDLFGDDDLFSRLYPKLLRSYAVDVLNEKPAGALTLDEADALLATARTGTWARRPTEGVGQALALEQKHTHGSALLDEGMTLHADLFEGEAAPTPAPYDSRNQLNAPNVQQRQPNAPILQQRQERQTQ